MKSMKNRNLKGSVLLAVVSVMSLLIIFMGTTLVLAAAANNRAHRSYTTSQAEYTARAALDSFTKAMETDKAVAAAVKDLAGPTEIDVEFSDSSIGHIGYFKADGSFVENKMMIEKAKDPKSPAKDLTEWVWTEKNEWMEVPVYKLTATARVGKETKTMSLYIRQKKPEESKPAELKGLQSGGIVEGGTTAGYFSGAYVVGATDDGSKTYNLHNGTTLDDAQSFFNGNLNVAGSGLEIIVNSSDSKTVILGNLDMQNSDFVKFGDKFNMASNYDQKEIPYLFVEGKITCINKNFNIGDGADNSKEQPYNIFAGSAEITNPVINADLYLMDSDKMSVIGNSGSTNLYKWSKSTYNNTKQQFESYGGSIYCNGDLTLKNGLNVSGSVRVAGNLTVDGTVNIGGDLIVGGVVTGKMPSVVGTFYGKAEAKLKDNIQEKILVAQEPDQNIKNNNRDKEEYKDYYENVVDEWGNSQKVWKDGTYVFIYGDKIYGSGEKDSEMTIYVDNGGNPVKAEDAVIAAVDNQYKGEIYPSVMTKESIYAKSQGEKEVKSSNSFVQTLTDVQNALGVVKDGSGNYSFDSDKYVSTLPELSGYSSELNRIYTEEPKDINKSYLELPDEAVILSGDGQTDYDKIGRSFTDADLGNGLTKEAITNAKGGDSLVFITNNVCFSGKYCDKTFYVTEDVDIILQEGTRFENCLFVIDDSKTVNFYIGKSTQTQEDNVGGTVYSRPVGVVFHSSNVLTTSLVKNHVINEGDSPSIYWYGEENSALRLTDGNSVLCGAFRCPKTTFICLVSKGPVKFSYVTSAGAKDEEPTIIGNALFKNATTSNNMSVCNTNAGNGDGDHNITTGVGYFETSYYTEY